MSRSGYSCDIEDNWRYIMWRGQVASAIRGKRGQNLLRELAEAMDAMPEKVLASDSLVNADGVFCALGVLGKYRGIDLSKIDDPEDYEAVADAFDVASPLVREIVFNNDGCVHDWKFVDVEILGPLRSFDSRHRTLRLPDEFSGRRRWNHMRVWVEANIK